MTHKFVITQDRKVWADVDVQFTNVLLPILEQEGLDPETVLFEDAMQLLAAYLEESTLTQLLSSLYTSSKDKSILAKLSFAKKLSLFEKSITHIGQANQDADAQEELTQSEIDSLVNAVPDRDEDQSPALTVIDTTQFAGMNKAQMIKHIMATRSITIDHLKNDILGLDFNLPSGKATKAIYANVYCDAVRVHKKNNPATDESSVAGNTTTQEGPVMYSKEEVAQLLAAQQADMLKDFNSTIATIENKLKQTEDAGKKKKKGKQEEASTTPVTSESRVLTEKERQAAIVECEKLIEKFKNKKAKALKKNDMDAFKEANIKFREYEEAYVVLTGGNITELRTGKYNGVSAKAAVKAYEIADVVEEQGHKAVDHGTSLLTSLFSGVMDITRSVVDVVDTTGKTTIKLSGEVGHAGVDLAAGSIRTGAMMLDSKKDKKKKKKKEVKEVPTLPVK